jgi:methyl-accepting chemotaxis protein
MKRLSLNAKLLLVVLLFTVASGAIAVRGILGLRDLNAITEDLVNHVSVRRNHWVDARDYQRQLTIREQEFIDEEHPDTVQKIQADVDSLYEKLAAEMALYLALASDFGQQKASEYSVVMDKWFNVHLRVRELKHAGKVHEAMELASTEGKEVRYEAEKFIIEMMEYNDKIMKEAVEKAEGRYESGRLFMIVFALGSVVVGFAFALYVLRQISSSISQVITQLETNSNQVTGASQQIASSSDSLSQAATEQAASLQETAASIEELNQMVQRNLEGARRAASLSGESQDSAEKGKEVVTEMSRAIAEIDSSNAEIMAQVEESNRRIAEITTVITEIGNKTKVINDIVFQTKLLSFNASVEAARAGEHGKGFAVVAEEVGNLAQMSGTAAKEISAMLSESVRKVDDIVNETRSKVEGLIRVGKEKVEVGTRIAEECSEVLNDIVGKVSEVSQMSQNIAHSSEEQAQGVDQITKAMHQLDQVTQTNAGAAEQTASAAEQLSGQSTSLKGIVHTLVASVHGEKVAAQQDVRVASKAAPVAPKAPVSVSEKKVEKKASKLANVVPFRKSEKKAPPPAGEKARAVVEVAKPIERASGDGATELDVPSENDPRFKDI